MSLFGRVNYSLDKAVFMEDDIYTSWLDIPLSRCPPDAYTLLGVPKGTTNAQFIESAALRRLKQIHDYAINSDPLIREQCAGLMNEIAQARRELLAAENKHKAAVPNDHLTAPSALDEKQLFSDSSDIQGRGQAPFSWVAVLALLAVGIFIGALGGYVLERMQTRSSIASRLSTMQHQGELKQKLKQAQAQAAALQIQMKSLKKAHQLDLAISLKPLLEDDTPDGLSSEDRHRLAGQLLDKAAPLLQALESASTSKTAPIADKANLDLSAIKLKGLMARGYRKLGESNSADALLKPVLESSLKLISAIDAAITKKRKQGTSRYTSLYFAEKKNGRGTRLYTSIKALSASPLINAVIDKAAKTKNEVFRYKILYAAYWNATYQSPQPSAFIHKMALKILKLSKHVSVPHINTMLILPLLRQASDHSDFAFTKLLARRYQYTHTRVSLFIRIAQSQARRSSLSSAIDTLQEAKQWYDKSGPNTQLHFLAALAEMAVSGHRYEIYHQAQKKAHQLLSTHKKILRKPNAYAILAMRNLARAAIFMDDKAAAKHYWKLGVAATKKHKGVWAENVHTRIIADQITSHTRELSSVTFQWLAPVHRQEEVCELAAELAKQGAMQKAFKVIKRIKRPTDRFYTHYRMLKDIKKWHEHTDLVNNIIKHMKKDTYLKDREKKILAVLYIKRGYFQEAVKLCDQLPAKYMPAAVNSFAEAGKPQIALTYFYKLPQAAIKPSDVRHLGLSIARTGQFSLLAGLLPQVSADVQAEPYLLAGIANGLLDSKVVVGQTASN